jgi:hypothetical protein
MISSFRTMCKYLFGNKLEIQDSWEKENLFFGSLPLSPYVLLPI